MEHLLLILLGMFLGFNLGVLAVALCRASREEEIPCPTPAHAPAPSLASR